MEVCRWAAWCGRSGAHRTTADPTRPIRPRRGRAGVLDAPVLCGVRQNGGGSGRRPHVPAWVRRAQPRRPPRRPGLPRLHPVPPVRPRAHEIVLDMQPGRRWPFRSRSLAALLSDPAAIDVRARRLRTRAHEMGVSRPARARRPVTGHAAADVFEMACERLPASPPDVARRGALAMNVTARSCRACARRRTEGAVR